MTTHDQMDQELRRQVRAFMCTACGYNERMGSVTLCPLHAAAEEMRATLADIVFGGLLELHPPVGQIQHDKARALLAKVEG